MITMSYQRTLSSYQGSQFPSNVAENRDLGPAPMSEKPVIFITGSWRNKNTQTPRQRQQDFGHRQPHLDAGSIPMLEISLAFLGKTYLLVGSILNFNQLSIVKPFLPF